MVDVDLFFDPAFKHLNKKTVAINYFLYFKARSPNVQLHMQLMAKPKEGAGTGERQMLLAFFNDLKSC